MISRGHELYYFVHTYQAFPKLFRDKAEEAMSGGSASGAGARGIPYGIMSWFAGMGGWGGISGGRCR